MIVLITFQNCAFQIDEVNCIKVSRKPDGSDAVRLPLSGQVLTRATLVSQFPEATGLKYFMLQSASWGSPAGSWMAVPVGRDDSFQSPPGTGWDATTTYIVVGAQVPSVVGKCRLLGVQKIPCLSFPCTCEFPIK